MHKNTGRALLAIAIVAVFTAGGCSSNDNNKAAKSSSGGSSSSSSSSSGGAVIKGLGNVQVHYPPASSSTDAEQIVVRGIIENPAQVSEVYVNAVPVQSDDGLATWSITVPLALGSNSLAVTSEDSAGTRTDVDVLLVERSPSIISPKASAIDQASGDLFLLDMATQSIIRIGVDTGTRTQLSPASGVTGNLLTDARGLILDKANNRLLVYQSEVEETPDEETTPEDGTDPVANEDGTTDADEDNINTKISPFIAIDLTTGAQSVFTVTPPGGARLLNSPRAIAKDDGVAYVADVEIVYADSELNRVPPEDENAERVGLFSIINSLDLGTGEMQILSAYGIPDTTLPIATGLQSLTTAPESDFLYALEITEKSTRIVKINKITGARTLFTTDGTSEDSDTVLALSNPSSLTLDYPNQRLLLQSSQRVLAIDLGTGKITVLSATGVPMGSPYPLSKFESIAFDSIDNTIYVADDALDSVFAIHGATGLRTWVSGAGGDDPEATRVFSTPTCVALAPQEQAAVVCDSLSATAFGYDLLTGEKTILARRGDTPEGETPKITYPVSAAPRTGTDAYLVLDNFNQRPGEVPKTDAPRLLSVDRVTGEIDIIHSFDDTRVRFVDLLYNPTQNAIYIAGSLQWRSSRGQDVYVPRITELRLDDGDATPRVVHEARSSDNYRFQGLKSIDMDYQNNRILALDSILNAVIAVDPATGERTPLSTLTHPVDGGPNFRTPQALVVDSDNSRALVLDSTLDAIIAVDLGTGQREIVYQSTGSDPDRLFNGKDLALHPFGYVLVVDDVKDALVAIDLKSNQLVRLAR